MQWFEALVLGLIQGLTEFLPISSSGHLLITKELFGIESQDATFEIVVHAATVLSTLFIFWKVIWDMIADLFRWRWTANTRYICLILVAIIPIMILGLFFKDAVEGLFVNGIGSLGPMGLVGIALIVTAILLIVSQYLSAHHSSEEGKPIGYGQALVIGIAQSLAVVPGLSRSGTTIATGMLLGNRKSELAQFSFLIVLPPVIGENLLSLVGGDFAASQSGISATCLLIGFLGAFFAGLFACKAMVALVKRAKLGWFGLYCFIVGAACMVWSFLK